MPEVGIENLKRIFVPLVKMIAAIIDSRREDSPGGKKTIWTELLMMAPNAVQILAAFALLADIWKEIKDLDPLEAEELAEVFAQEFNIAADDVEQAIEELLEIGVSFGPPIERLIEWFKRHAKPKAA